MNLKFRYATYLFGVLLVILFATLVIAKNVSDGNYLVAGIVALLLYASTFALGKRLRKVFFVLSLLKFLRKNNGSASLPACQQFIGNSLSSRCDEQERLRLSHDVISILKKEKLVEEVDTFIILTQF